MHKSRHLLACLSAVLLLAAGCGGGGEDAGSGRAGVFVSDQVTTAYVSVWVTIFKVEVGTTTGEFQTVFHDPAGRVIDLKTLRDATGARFAFLGDAVVTGAQHNKARVTVGSVLNALPNPNAVAQPLTLTDDFPRNSLGQAEITFTLAPRNLASGSDDIVIDFDLSAFEVLTGNRLRAVLKEGVKDQLHNRQRHERDHYEGHVSNLTATTDGFRFTLSRGPNASITVVTDGSTAIYNANQAPNPVLANDQEVKVQGTFDVTADVLRATHVRIDDGSHADHPEVHGVPTAINPGAGTFAVTIREVEGFMPFSAIVNVTTTDNTVFRSDAGILMTKTEFFDALAAASGVEVEGPYSANTNAIAALKVKLDDDSPGNDHHEAEAKGKVTNPNETAGTFTLNPVTEFEGFTHTGNVVNVTLAPGATFKNDSATITRAQFFAALGANTTVKVHGAFTGGVLTADRAEIR